LESKAINGKNGHFRSTISNMFRTMTRFALRGLLFAILAGLVLFGIPGLIAEDYASSRIYTSESAPHVRVAIVFGAGLNRNGTPSPVLRDRVEMAVRLYQSGKVDKLLMSGDNRFENYNEPGAMRDYAISLGVPEQDIVLDYAGRRTYDTCYRAQKIFGVTHAILVTQSFHLPRALITCNNLGVESSGVSADIRTYLRRSYLYWWIRELPATTVAFWEVWVTRPLPVLGKPEPIFSSDALVSPRVLALP
jgi:SanA protein